jgi:hypothetical protein
MPRMVPTFAVVGVVLLLAGIVPLAIYGVIGGSELASGSAGRAASETRLIVALQLSDRDDRRAASPTSRQRAVRIPAEATDIRIDLDIVPPIDAPRDIAVDLIRLGDGSVPTDGRWQLVSAGRGLSLTVPSGELPEGDYTVTVRRRGGDGPDLAAHAFRVSRE